MKCPACQKEIPTNASACSACGLSFDDATQKLEHPEPPPIKSKQKSYSSLDSIDDARFVPGTILAERYRIVGLLGKGGMGEVYRAEDLKLGQPVALKFLPDHLLSDGAALARFHREVRVARQVSHKNVCRVYDIGETDGRHFLSMEFIKGEELSSLLRRIGRLPQDKALQLARQICAGLAAAHDTGFLHRDLKPSNVMIDEHGNARVLDFGLGGLTDEFAEEEVRAGTPAYMSPEQIEGKEQTVQSDIYSLGVLFYELFTGKKAFEAPSLNELIQLRRSDTAPSTPTSIVKGLDPLIEKVIDRCMQKDPAARPASALQVAAALPGGDPIAAALAAGETPSPEMVAAAPKKGTLRPLVAGAFLASIVLLIGASMFLSKWSTVHRVIPLPKSSELLREQASQTVRSLGYTNAPADVASGFGGQFLYYSYLGQHRKTINSWEVLKSSQPPLMLFWYRHSPTLLIPNSEQYVTRFDPPRDVPGMIDLSLNTEGRLTYLKVVPERVSLPTASESKQPGSVATPIDWSWVFSTTGIDPAQFHPTESHWTPPHAYDARQAWTGTFANLPQVPMRIEAASFRGKPVYFEVIAPWSQEVYRAKDPQTTGEKIGVWVLFAVFFGIMALCAFLALRNLRLGRGDRRGAFRVALFVFMLRLGVWAFATHHIGDTNEFLLLVTGLQSGLFWSSFVGLMYLALEPYLRRRWPERIISWNRLLAGDFRDPLVGRDVLVGAAIGALTLTVMYGRVALTRLLIGDVSVPDVSTGVLNGLTGVSGFGYLLFNQLTAGISQAFMIVFLLLFLSLIFRRDWIGIAVGTLILVAVVVPLSLDYEHWFGSIMIIAVILLLAFCAVRLGPLALMAALFVFHLWVFYPVTTEITAWYASTFVMISIVLLAMSTYAFYISLGGQKILSGKLLEGG